MKRVIMELGVPNKNGRTYPPEEMAKAIERYNDKVCYGEVGSAVNVDLGHASHRFMNLEVFRNAEGCYLRGDLTLLDTSCGKMLREIMDTTEVAFRPAGIGELRQTENGLEVINYELLSINAMAAQEAA